MSNRLLIVDDEDQVRTIFAEYLADFGYEVHQAADGSEALSKMEAHDFEVIFLDLHLPDMNGLQVCRQLRATKSGAAVFAVTGFLRDFSLDQCKDAGFDDFFAKPVKLTVLHNAALRGFELAKQRKEA